jgi:osmotically-inducible protein OsmY
MPSNAMPSNALPGMTGATGQMGGATGQQGQAGFIGLGSGFIGQTPGTQQQTGAQNRPGQNRNTARGGRGQNQNQNQMGGAGNQQQQRTIRPQLIVAFTAPLPTSDVMSTRLQSRLQKIKKTSPYEGVQVDVEGTKVILRGEVNSAQDARMASMIARLEPGVRKVDNQLTVREPAPAVE